MGKRKPSALIDPAERVMLIHIPTYMSLGHAVEKAAYVGKYEKETTQFFTVFRKGHSEMSLHLAINTRRPDLFRAMHMVERAWFNGTEMDVGLSFVNPPMKGPYTWCDVADPDYLVVFETVMKFSFVQFCRSTPENGYPVFRDIRYLIDGEHLERTTPGLRRYLQEFSTVSLQIGLGPPGDDMPSGIYFPARSDVRMAEGPPGCVRVAAERLRASAPQIPSVDPGNVDRVHYQ